MRNFNRYPTRRAVGGALIPIVGSVAFLAACGKSEQAHNAAATAKASPAASASEHPSHHSPSEAPSAPNIPQSQLCVKDSPAVAKVEGVPIQAAMAQCSTSSAAFDTYGYTVRWSDLGEGAVITASVNPDKTGAIYKAVASTGKQGPGLNVEGQPVAIVPGDGDEKLIVYNGHGFDDMLEVDSGPDQLLPNDEQHILQLGQLILPNQFDIKWGSTSAG